MYIYQKSVGLPNYNRIGAFTKHTHRYTCIKNGTEYWLTANTIRKAQSVNIRHSYSEVDEGLGVGSE